MGLFERVNTDDLTPSALWADLNAESKRLAAQALYSGKRAGDSARIEADAAIAASLRFRPASVRKLPTSRRVDYLLQRVFPDDSLASSLIMALHFEHRAPILESFLDQLDIPHQEGVIDEEHELVALDPSKLDVAVRTLVERFDRDEVELYLASLLALDPVTWGALREILQPSD